MTKRTCSDPECDRSAAVRGMCQKHYQRWRRTIPLGVEMPPKPPRSPHPALIDRTGQRYGRLVVIGRAESRRRPSGRVDTYWLCQCDCGNEAEVHLGATESCGRCTRKRSGFVSGGCARNQILRGYIAGAHARGLCWELTESDFDRLTSQACLYCGIEPSTVAQKRSIRFIYNGIDRKDNDLGYTPENVVSCCKTCNYAKKDMSFDVFMAWIARLTEYHWFHPDVMPSRLLRSVRKSA